MAVALRSTSPTPVVEVEVEVRCPLPHVSHPISSRLTARRLLRWRRRRIL
jgi:hypothetical protein